MKCNNCNNNEKFMLIKETAFYNPKLNLWEIIPEQYRLEYVICGKCKSTDVSDTNVGIRGKNNKGDDKNA